MNERVKKLWVEALTSGEFKQGRGKLHSDNGSYCCLGVLCELHRREVGGSWKESKSPYLLSKGLCYLEADIYLPEPVMEWAGLYENEPRVPVENKMDLVPLSTVNDSGEDFPTIARRIQEKL